MSDEQLMEFPCEFQLKAFGHSAEDFEAHIVSLVELHSPVFSRVSSRTSSGGKYCSVSVTINAQSRAQVEAIYQEFSRSQRVLYAL